MKELANDYIDKEDSYFNSCRSEITEFIPDDAKTLLDVGCGAGQFGAYLKSSRKIEVWGVEHNVKAAKEASSIIDKVINSGFSKDISCPEVYFDVITFNDCLEHFPNVEEPLNYAKKLLKKNGVIVVSLPNVRYINNIKHLLIDKDWKYTDDGILDRTHLRFFTKKSMTRTFNELGFKVVSQKGINKINLRGWKLRLLNLFFNKYMSDMKYLQFVTIIKNNNRSV